MRGSGSSGHSLGETQTLQGGLAWAAWGRSAIAGEGGLPTRGTHAGFVT